METKVCNICNNEKNLTEFYKKHSYCKKCHLIKKQEWRKNNLEEYKKQTKNYYEKSKKIQAEKKKKWISENRKKYNSYWTNRKKKDILFKLKTQMRSRICNYLGFMKVTKKNKTMEVLGCTPQELKEHLEKQFVDGMNWDNYGVKGWNIDHIIPLSSAKNEEEFYKLCHFTNLQPLWWRDNLIKRDKIVEPVIIQIND